MAMTTSAWGGEVVGFWNPMSMKFVEHTDCVVWFFLFGKQVYTKDCRSKHHAHQVGASGS